MTAAPQEHLLQVEHLVKRFTVRGTALARRHQITAIDDVSFTVQAGRTLGLIGESGCGKSTLARILAGIERQDSGSVRLDSQDLAALRDRDRRRAASAVQMVFQDPMGSLDPRMTIERIVVEPLEVHDLVHTTSDRRDHAARLLALVGLDPELLPRYPHALSGGQRQRVGIARALALQPRILIADEPIAALDVSVAAQIVNLLSRLTHDLHLAMIFISHDLRMIRHVADDVAVMYQGRFVEQGHPQSVFTHPGHDYTKTLLAAVPHIPEP